MSKRPGGWEKFKAAKEKKRRDNEELKSIPKLHNYFILASNDCSTSEVQVTSQTSETSTTSVSEAESEQQHHVINEDADTHTDITGFQRESAGPTQEPVTVTI